MRFCCERSFIKPVFSHYVFFRFYRMLIGKTERWVNKSFTINTIDRYAQGANRKSWSHWIVLDLFEALPAKRLRWRLCFCSACCRGFVLFFLGASHECITVCPVSYSSHYSHTALKTKSTEQLWCRSRFSIPSHGQWLLNDRRIC